MVSSHSRLIAASWLASPISGLPAAGGTFSGASLAGCSINGRGNGDAAAADDDDETAAADLMLVLDVTSRVDTTTSDMGLFSKEYGLKSSTPLGAAATAQFSDGCFDSGSGEAGLSGMMGGL